LIMADREMVELNREVALWLDINHFRRLVAESRQHNHPPESVCPECVPLLSEAAALYSNDFMAGFSLADSAEFDDWQFFQSESLRQELAGLLERLVAGLSAQGSYEVSIPHARRWVVLDPLHEPAQRQLIHLYGQAGQAAAGLRQYEEYAKLLDEELGLPPEEETTTIYEAINAKRRLGPFIKIEEQRSKKAAEREKIENQKLPGEPQPQPFSTPTPPPLPQAPLFVARQQELTQLDTWLEAALRGESRVVFVTGEAGQGKSALLQAFARRALVARPNLIMAGGTCNAYTGIGDPYLPFREILGLLTGAIDAQTVVGGSVERLHLLWPQSVRTLVDEGPDLLDTFVPAKILLNRATAFAPKAAAWLEELQALVGRKLKQPAGAAVQQAALFEQYIRVIQSLSRQAPLLLLLDDLQWADTGSTNLLFHLGRRLAGQSVLIVGAYRPAEVALGRDGQPHPLAFVLNELQRQFGDISLNLAQAEGEAFVNALLDSEPNQLSQAFRAALFQLTAGHPLFTLELLRGMQERGDLVKNEAGRWVEQAQLDWTSLPPRVEGAIGARLSRLEPAWHNLLQIASVEGESFTAEVVAQVLQVDAPSVIHQLSRVLDRLHLLVRAEGFKQEGEVRLSRYRFRHILIQRYLYQSLDEVERVHYHEAVGRVFEALYGQQTEQIVIQLAHHYKAANRPEKARNYLAQAGDQAQHAAALAEAARYYQAALELWPETAQAEQATLQRKLGECLWTTGQLPAALKAFEACYELCEKLANRIEAGAIQRLIGRIYWEQGERAIAWQHYQQALKILESEPESIELTQALSAISQMHMLASEYEPAIAWGERALALAKKLGAQEVIAHASNNIGVALAASTNPERGLALLRESLQLALTLNMPHEACRAHVNLGEALLWHDHYAEAEAIFNQLLRYTTRVGAVMFQGVALVRLTELDWWQGRWVTALTQREQLRRWRDQFQGAAVPKVWASTALGRIYNDLGQPQLACRELEGELSTARSLDEAQTTAPHLGQLARSLAALEQAAETVAIIQEFLAVHRRIPFGHAHTIPALLVACRWLTEQPSPSSLKTAEDCLHHLEQIEAQFHSQESAAALAEARGLAALGNQQTTVAVEQFRQASTHWGSLNRPYDQVRALNDLGQALRQLGEMGQAQAVLTQALSLIETLAEQLEDPATKATFLNSPLAQQLSQASLARPDPTPQHNLPAQTTSFIGREKELAENLQLLDRSGCRLLTLVGPGGIGKTRLALEIARRCLELRGGAIQVAFADGVYFVNLAPLSLSQGAGDGLTEASQATNLILAAIAAALEFSFQGAADVKMQLLAHLRQKELLLVLDNFEQLVEGAGLLSELLQVAPDLRLLVTSRERLNLQEEWVREVDGLEYPEGDWTTRASAGVDIGELRESPISNLQSHDAVALFCSHAQRVRGAFNLSESEAPHVLRLCQVVEGSPLALELAASWLRVLSCAEVVAGIEQRLDFLSSSLRNIPERHRSMRAVFEQSWQMLSEPEQTAFGRLSLFKGGFQREAALVVARATLSTLVNLVDKSLLRLTPWGRYQLHELLRQFAIEKHLTEAEPGGTPPESALVVWQRYSTYYLNLVGQREASLRGSSPQSALSELRAELDNIRQAWQWAVVAAQVEAIEGALGGLARFYDLSSLFEEGATVFGQAANDLQGYSRSADEGTKRASQKTVVKLWVEQARLLNRRGLSEQALQVIPQAVELAQQTQDISLEALAYHQWGETLSFHGQPALSQTRLEQALALARAAGLGAIEAETLRHLGIARIDQGDTTGALTFYLESLACFRRLKDRRGEGMALNNLAYVQRRQGNWFEAETHFRQALHIFEEIDYRWGQDMVLNNLGNLHYDLGRYSQAQTLCLQGWQICLEIKDSWGECHLLNSLGNIMREQGDFDAAHSYYQQALQLWRTIGARFYEGVTLAELALLEHLLGHNQAAADFSHQAEQIGREVVSPEIRATALTHLGHTQAGLGLLAEATASYHQALTLRRELEQLHFAREIVAGLSRVALAQDDLAQAQALVAELLPQLQAEQLYGTREPLRVYLTCYQVLQAGQDPHATEVLAAAQHLLQARATAIEDERLRRCFFESIPAHQEIVQAARLNGVKWPKASASA
jgi:predicted ATPase/DNA-binding SARP family transcriptional activator